MSNSDELRKFIVYKSTPIRYEELKQFLNLMSDGSVSDLALANAYEDGEFFSKWLFDVSPERATEWNGYCRDRNYEGLNVLISGIEEDIMQGFVETTRDMGIQLRDNLMEFEYESYRSCICNVYVFVFSEYLEGIFQDFEIVCKLVYDKIFEVEDTVDEGCEDIL